MPLNLYDSDGRRKYLDRYAPSLREPARANEEMVKALEYLSHVSGPDLLALHQSEPAWHTLNLLREKTDAMIDSGAGFEGLRVFAAAIAGHDPGTRRFREEDAAALWDMLADWLGGWEHSCEAASSDPACALPLPHPFALDLALERYASAFGGNQKSLIKLHYADTLLRLGRIAGADTVLGDPGAPSGLHRVKARGLGDAALPRRHRASDARTRRHSRRHTGY